MKPKLTIDEFFRTKLVRYEVSPPDSLWENIQMARLGKTKPKPAPWSLWLVSATGIILLGFLATEVRFPNKSDAATQAEPSVPELPDASKEASIETLRQANTPIFDTPASLPRQTASPVFHSHLPASPGESADAPALQETAAILAESPAFNQTEKESFAPFAPISTLRQTLPHESSLYSEYLPVPFNKKLWFAKIDFLLSQDFIHSTLQSKTPIFEPYAALRNELEDFKVSHSFMLRMGISTIKGWGIRSGIQYSRWQQTLTLQFPDVSQTSNAKNIYETIDIPLILTKEHSFGKVRTGFSAGTYLNMAFNQKGRFYGPTGTLIEFTSSKPGTYPAFKNRLGASIYAGISLSIPLGNSLEFLAEPYLRTGIPSISADDYVLNQKIRYGGIYIGIRKQIGKGFYLP